eukprot:365889-Chlamydomonas_euryale.AAC.1
MGSPPCNSTVALTLTSGPRPGPVRGGADQIRSDAPPCYAVLRSVAFRAHYVPRLTSSYVPLARPLCVPDVLFMSHQLYAPHVPRYAWLARHPPTKSGRCNI